MVCCHVAGTSDVNIILVSAGKGGMIPILSRLISVQLDTDTACHLGLVWKVFFPTFEKGYR